MSNAMRIDGSVATRQGPRSAEDILNELFILARARRSDMEDGAAYMNAERDGEQIEIRVTVKRKQ